MGEHDTWGRHDPTDSPYPADQQQRPPQGDGAPAAPETAPGGWAPPEAEGPTVGVPANPSTPLSQTESSQPASDQTPSDQTPSDQTVASHTGGAYPASSPYARPGDLPTASYQSPYPSAGYPADGYPANQYPVNQSGGYPANQYGTPYSAAPYAASPYSAPPNTGSPYGAQYGQPGPGVGPGPGGRTSSGGRAAKVVVVAIAGLALALCSGVAGGLVANQTAHPGPASTVTRAAAPQVDRSSVGGVAQKVLPSVVDISTSQGEGSGVILTSDGAIITNNHVVESANGGDLQVSFSDGKTAKATVVGTDPVGDIAVIKAQNVSGLGAAKFGDSDAAQVGDTVLAIGSPLGLQGSVSEGIVSALHRTIDEPAENGAAGHSIGDAIQTDAAINPGNSGGALVNLSGEVIGINTAIATSGQGSGNIGVGFAISGNKAKSAADQILKGQKVSHPYLGVQLTDGTGGALVADVVANGPAARAGLQKGDVITKAGSTNVGDVNALIGVIQSGKPGDQLQLTVQRGGSTQQVTVTLGDTP